MSIYATLWTLHFPREGDDYYGCEWIEVSAQAVPGHVGTPTEGFGYESGDPFADFLPPAITLEDEDDARLRAVFIVTGETTKGTPRCGQEYVDPLLVLTGDEYAEIRFAELHQRICAALRGDRPQLVAQYLSPGGTIRVFFDDGSSEVVDPESVM
jgi:hypothetical protein